MTDLANLVLAVDATQVKTGTAALEGLTAAGQRAEAATIGLGGGMKGAGVQAAALAAGAQASARAAMDQAAGFKAAAGAASLNTIAMRETLVVARELSRGNFTRIPGSLSLLAANVSGGIGGFASALATQIGLIKKVQNAELAEAATAAATAAAGVRAAAQRAGANILAADTETALAQAAVRTAETTEAEAAAQVRLAEAYQVRAAAATEAKIAEDALAVAQGRAAEASAASAAAMRTTIGATGIGLLAFGAIAGVAYGAIKQFQEQVKDDGSLTRFRDNLGLTHAEMLKLSDGVEKGGGKIKKLGDVTVTFGDVMHGVWQEVSREVGSANAWDKTKSASAAAESAIIKGWLFVAENITAALNYAEDRAIIAWKNFPAAFGDIFVQAVNLAIGAINSLVQRGTDVLNAFLSTANKIPGVNIGKVSAPEIGLLNNPNAGAALRGSAAIAGAPTYAQELARARAQDQAAFANIGNDAEQHLRDRMKSEADALKADRAAKRQKKEPRNPADDEIAKLIAQIAAENALTQAYLTNDAAALKAEADEKAMVLAVEKHATAAQTAALKEKELALAIATAAAAGAKRVADLRFESDTRKLLNDQIAAGTLTAAKANNELKLEDELRPRVAALTAANIQIEATELALTAATGAAKGGLNKQLGDEIKQRDVLLGIIRNETKAFEANNDETARGQALVQIASNDNEIAKLKLEASLMGASNRERAVAIAQLEAVQQLDQMGVNDPTTRASYVNSAVNKAVAGVQSPFQQWAQDIPQTADAINQALQSIEFKGIDSLASSITDVITGTKNLGQAFSDISKQIIGDILQMIIKMLIFKALSSVFGGVFGGGGGNPSVGLGAIGANGLVLSGGNVIPFANGGVFNSPTLFPMSGGRTGLMAEAGPEAVMPLSRDNRGRLGVKAQGGSNDNAHVVEVRIATDQNFHAEVQQIAGRTIISAAPTIAKSAVDATVKMMSRRPITGGRG